MILLRKAEASELDEKNAMALAIVPVVPISVDMVYLANHHQRSSNPFGNPYGATVHPYGSGVPVQAYNPYTGRCFVRRTRSLSGNMEDYE
ncbi:putative clathrin assembly protein At5g35200 [Fagus crenata]